MKNLCWIHTNFWVSEFLTMLEILLWWYSPIVSHRLASSHVSIKIKFHAASSFTVIPPPYPPEKRDYVFSFYFEKTLDFKSNQVNVQSSCPLKTSEIFMFFLMFPGGYIHSTWIKQKKGKRKRIASSNPRVTCLNPLVTSSEPRVRRFKKHELQD